MTVKPGSWTVFSWEGGCFGGSYHTAMVHREKHSLYHPFKKTYIWGIRWILWASNMSPRSPLSWNCKGRQRKDSEKTYMTNSQILIMPFLTCKRFCWAAHVALRISCSFLQQYHRGTKTYQLENWSIRTVTYDCAQGWGSSVDWMAMKGGAVDRRDYVFYSNK